jgi:ATP-dependent helicase HrpB
VLLATGTGAAIAPESGVIEGEFIVAHDIGRTHASAPTPRIRIATRVDREWLMPTSSDVVHEFHRDSGTVRARRVDRYDALVLAQHPVAVDAAVAAGLLADAWLERGPTEDDARLLRRARFAGVDLDLARTIGLAAHGARRLDDIALTRAIPAEAMRTIERAAPETLTVPSGRRIRLEYKEDGTVEASVKLQELFGLAETPTIGPRRVPVTFALLAPNGRPVQITRDLRSFWDRTYPEVRKELRGRYPKHRWPEDPCGS